GVVERADAAVHEIAVDRWMSRDRRDRDALRIEVIGRGGRGADRLPQQVVAIANCAARTGFEILSVRIVADRPRTARVEPLDDNQQTREQARAAEGRVVAIHLLELGDEAT